MEYVELALAKGRLVDSTLELFAEIGLVFPGYSKRSRKVVFTNDEWRVRLVLVKSADVPTYVERGAVDMGIVGKDMLLESGALVYELVDLGFGSCKMVVASKNEAYRRKVKPVVATKYPAIAQTYFREQGRPIETITLHGSVELAPLIGLSDCIVDIVETGTTLRENGLHVTEEIADLSARLVVNRPVSRRNSSASAVLLIRSRQLWTAGRHACDSHYASYRRLC